MVTLLSPVVRDYLVRISPQGMADLMEELIFSVWNLSDAKNSLYFRGSFSRSQRRHTPLDVDMYYVLNEEDPTLPACEDICIALHEQYPNLPRPDLSIFTKENLLNPGIRQMTRLILTHDGTFVYGENLLPTIPSVAFTERNADIIWYKQTEIVAKKLRGVERFALVHIDQGLLAYFYSSVAKSVLRLVMHIFMLSEAVFTRDVVRCAEYIQQLHPELSDAVEVMLAQIDGGGSINSQLPASARLLFNALKWKSPADAS